LKMKIFYASQSFYPHIGGVSTYLLNLAKGLMARGDEVLEVHLRPPNESSKDTIDGINVFRIPREPLNDDLLKGYSNFKERIYKECHGEGDFFKKEPLISCCSFTGISPVAFRQYLHGTFLLSIPFQGISSSSLSSI